MIEQRLFSSRKALVAGKWAQVRDVPEVDEQEMARANGLAGLGRLHGDVAIIRRKSLTYTPAARR